MRLLNCLHGESRGGVSDLASREADFVSALRRYKDRIVGAKGARGKSKREADFSLLHVGNFSLSSWRECVTLYWELSFLVRNHSATLLSLGGWLIL